MITTEYIVGAVDYHTASLRSPSHVAKIKINHKSKKSRKSKKSKKSHGVNGV